MKRRDLSRFGHATPAFSTMQTTRDSNLPLFVALLIIAAAHLAAVPWFKEAMTSPGGGGGGGDAKASTDPDSKKPDKPLNTPDVELGRPESRQARVAWISYEDFERLTAPVQAHTEQPTLQQKADPVQQAPLELDPTPPAPSASSRQPSNAPALAEQVALAPPPSTPLPPTTDADAPFKQPTERVGPRRPQRPQPQAQVEPQVAAAPGGQPAHPTAAPRSDREADPVQLDPAEFEWKGDNVIVGPGLEIKTARPDISIPSRFTAAPRDIKVEVTFNSQGQVTEAHLIGSTGYSDWDAAILSSLYKWTAKGKQLEEADNGVTIPMPYRFVD